MQFRFHGALRCAALLAAIICFSASGALAAIIQVTINATGTGTIGATPFNNASFTITTQYNSANRGAITGGFGVPNVLAAINISGIGTAAFTQNTRIFSNESNQAAGFSRDTNGNGLNGNDILNVDGPAFATWDLTTPVGPVFDATPSPVNQATNLSTSLGTLSFTAYSNATFTATVPEPATAAALLTATAAAATMRRRRLMSS
jgi:hypothetical protein